VATVHQVHGAYSAEVSKTVLPNKYYSRRNVDKELNAIRASSTHLMQTDGRRWGGDIICCKVSSHQSDVNTISDKLS